MPAADRLRKGLIASVHMARADMGLDEETYRGLLSSVTGRDSAARCSLPQLKAVLAEFRARGWTPRPRPAKSLPPAVAPELRPRHRKILALCLSQGRDLDYAEAVIRRMSRGTETLASAPAARLDACIAALARQARREQEDR